MLRNRERGRAPADRAVGTAGVLSLTAVCDPIAYHPVQGDSNVTPANSPSGYTPANIDGAYGISAINIGGIAGTGSGQTIAIVNAYNDPNIVSDVAAFSSQFGLPQFGSGGPTLTVLNQTGGTRCRPPWGAREGGKWRSRWTWNGPTPSPPRPTSFCSRPAAPSDLGLDDRGQDGRRPFRRLRGLDELGPAAKSPARLPYDSYFTTPAITERHIPGVHGR